MKEKIKGLELEELELPENKVILTFICTLGGGRTLRRGIRDGYDIHEVNEFLRLICPEADELGIVHFHHPEQYRTLLGIILETVKNKLFSWEKLTEGGFLYV